MRIPIFLKIFQEFFSALSVRPYKFPKAAIFRFLQKNFAVRFPYKKGSDEGILKKISKKFLDFRNREAFGNLYSRAGKSLPGGGEKDGIDENRRRLVYICSPYRGDIAGNTERARRYSRFAVDRGMVPIAPHLLFPQFMDEDTERDLVMRMDLIVLEHCSELWVFGNCITKGMKAEIDRAEQLNMNIRYFAEEMRED